MTFLVLAGTILCFQAGRYTAARSSASDLSVLRKSRQDFNADKSKEIGLLTKMSCTTGPFSPFQDAFAKHLSFVFPFNMFFFYSPHSLSLGQLDINPL